MWRLWIGVEGTVEGAGTLCDVGGVWNACVPLCDVCSSMSEMFRCIDRHTTGSSSKDKRPTPLVYWIAELLLESVKVVSCLLVFRVVGVLRHASGRFLAEAHHK